MLREMEKQKQMQSSSKDTADAKLEVFKEEVETRAVQLMQKALKTSRIGSIGTEDLSKLSATLIVLHYHLNKNLTTISTGDFTECYSAILSKQINQKLLIIFWRDCKASIWYERHRLL